MGYALFTARKTYYCNMINQINLQLDQICQQKQSLLNLSANIADGKVTVDELVSDPMNFNNYMGFIEGSAAFNQSEEGAGNLVGTIGGFLTNKEYSEQDAAILAQLLDESLGTEYAKIQSKRLTAEENKLELQQKRLETKLTAAQNQLQAVEQAEQKAIQNATPKYAGIA